MSEKYIDLFDPIKDAFGLAPDADDVLCWLDEHPDQVPGRTITDSELTEIAKRHESIRDLVGMLGFTIVPDPPKSDAEKLAEVIEVVRKRNRGFSVGDKADSRILAEFLAEQGVKAPEAGGEA